jgi:hypothetical protein
LLPIYAVVLPVFLCRFCADFCADFYASLVLFARPISDEPGPAMSLSVTFDSNTLDKAARPPRFPKDPDQAAYTRVYDALSTGRLKGYFSETHVTLEGIKNVDRVKVLGSTRLDQQSSSNGKNAITLSLTVQQDRKPLPPEFPRRIQAAHKIGMRALRGPARFGWVCIKDDDGTFFEPDASMLERIQRSDRTNEMADAIAARGVGHAIAVKLGLDFSVRDGASGEWWLHGLLRAKDVLECTQVERAVAEWADGDSIAAHYGYGIDLFCSKDFGQKASSASVLDCENRKWLNEKFGVQFVTLVELADKART